MVFHVLGIETSCDETSAAVVRLQCPTSTEAKDPKSFSGLESLTEAIAPPTMELLSDVTARQEEVHLRFGGVVPELASRRHLESLLPVVRAALEKSGLSYQQLHAVAVTNRPGLIGSLMVGVNAAKTICYTQNIPLIPINHLEAHLGAVLLSGKPLRYPCVGLIISGGHTSLYEIDEGWRGFRPLGHTRDDAAGEAFDKGARLLGLPYPGGPQMAQLAEAGNPKAIDFPRALPGRDQTDFSFSGLKTSLSHFLKTHSAPNLPDVCASFQEAIVDALVAKTVAAMKRTGHKDLIVAGGVAANTRLREKLKVALPSQVELHIPPPALCTDNGAMIAALGALRFLQKDYVQGADLFQLEVSPRTEAKNARGKKPPEKPAKKATK